MKLASLRLVAIVAILFTNSLLAQVATGTPPFGSFGGGTFDTINLGNLNVHFEVPIIAKAGRGLPFTYTQAYDSSVYRKVGTSWQPDGNWGWHVSSEALTGWVEYASAIDTCVDIRGRDVVYTYYDWNQYHDMHGVNHWLSNLRTVDTNGLKCNPAAGTRDGTATTLDGSNYTLKVSSSNIFTVTPPWGGIIWPSKSSTGSVTDANGNTISTTGSVFTDTLGQTVLTVAGTAPSPVTLTYTAPGSVAKQYTVNYTVSHVRTAFNCSGVNEYDHTNIPLITSIVLPDNNGQYTFAYEGTPNAQDGAVTGRIASVTLPSGGTITYSYTGGSNGIVCDDGSTAGLNRTTADGTTQYSRSGSGTAWTTTITDASSAHNQTSINFRAVGANFYETARTAYSGSGPGVLLTTYTCYNGATPDCSNTAISLPIARRTVTTKLDNNQQSKIDVFYDSYGRVIEVDEYDFGTGTPGSPMRKTFTGYAGLGNGIANRVSSVIVKDGSGVKKASVTYGYDETAVTATSGVPQHDSVTGSRGNLTSVSRWVSGSDYLTQQFTYFDTGYSKQRKKTTTHKLLQHSPMLTAVGPFLRLSRYRSAFLALLIGIVTAAFNSGRRMKTNNKRITPTTVYGVTQQLHILTMGRQVSLIRLHFPGSLRPAQRLTLVRT